MGNARRTRDRTGRPHAHQHYAAVGRTATTPLTGQNRLDGREPLRRKPNKQQPAKPAKQTPPCQRCGNALPRPGRTYCDQYLPNYQREHYAEAFHGSGLRAIETAKQRGNDPRHGDTAATRRAETNVQRKREAREWDDRYGKLTDLSAFEREILPLIHDVPLSRRVHATGLSLRYVSLVRRGERTPHPRHWQNLANACELGEGVRDVGAPNTKRGGES